MSQAPHPRMHGLTHVTGGADPIPGLLPGGAGTYTDRVIAEPSLLAYWPLSDTAVPCADISGNDKPLTVATGSPTFLQPGPLPDSAYPYAVALDGTFGLSGSPESLRRFDDPADAADSYFSFGATDPFTLEMWVFAAGWPAAGFPTIAMLTLGGGTNFIALNSYGGDYDIAREVVCKGVKTTGVTLNQGTWVHVAATFDGTVARIYFDAAAIAAGTGNSSQTGASQRVEVGGLFLSDLGHQASWNGMVAHVAVYNQALTQGQLAAHLDGADVEVGAAGAPGEVLSVGDDGQPVWEPPGVTVEHGDGPPAPDTVTNPWTVSGGTSSSGWHLEAHVETAVLYDSSPGRFDVPSMKWVRVPFNTVRFWRRWEPTVGATNLKTEWLADDRGLTTQARDGILHITAGMEGTADVDGYHQRVVYWPFSPEWPFLDWSKLPNSPISVPGFDPANIDAYVRAARAVDLSHGLVLRDSTAGPTARQFFEWDMWVPADGTPEWVGYTVDNPYPVYPVWPARPLVLPPPYPKLTDAQSGQYYAPQKTVATSVTLAAGSNLCVQAWQDAPWLLRFSTDAYRIPYPGLQPKYLLRPHLAVSYRYDPETIDHTTGKLL